MIRYAAEKSFLLVPFYDFIIKLHHVKLFLVLFVCV